MEEKKKKISRIQRTCNKSDFYNRTDDYNIFKKLLISDFFCFDFYNNFTLKGIYTATKMSYLKVLLSLNDKYMKNFT